MATRQQGLLPRRTDAQVAAIVAAAVAEGVQIVTGNSPETLRTLEQIAAFLKDNEEMDAVLAAMGIASASVNESGHLILTRNDGTSFDAGVVVGPRGEQGVAGERGEKGELGAPGKDGVDGQQGEQGNPGVDGKDGKDGVNGAPGERGSRFLGRYASVSSLPPIDGVSIKAGDFAYTLDTGELWRAE